MEMEEKLPARLNFVQISQMRRGYGVQGRIVMPNGTEQSTEERTESDQQSQWFSVMHLSSLQDLSTKLGGKGKWTTSSPA